MFDQTQMKQLIQAAEQALYACTHQTVFDAWLSKRTKHCPSNTRTKEMFYVFDYQTRPNTIKHDQTRLYSTKQGVQTVKCSITKQCLMVFGRQTFIVCPGRYTFCTGVTLFALVLRLNCTALSQSESSNFFMYIISR